MSDKPPKRLVSKGRYIQVMGTKLSLLTVAAGTVIGGTLATVVALNEMFISFFYPHETKYTLVNCVWFAFGSLLLLVGGIAMHLRFNKIPSVEPITPRNACFLPVTETLVRASELPPSQQQDELLRASQYGMKTPAEELLRTTKGNGQNV